MKFLCVPCDAPMKLLETHPPDRGSISLVYSCPECGYEMAMMTNPYETQVVGSMGVKIGNESKTDKATAASGSGCPFGKAVQEMGGQPRSDGDGLPWTDDARERLSAMPDFVRPMAKTGIEKFAKERGHERVDGKLLDAAKDFFGM